MLRVVCLVFALVFAAAPAAAEKPLTVFAAASLKEALEEIGAAFSDASGHEVVYSFSGTGALARQVEAGAPADVFVAADNAWMTYVAERGAVVKETVKPIAGNTLVIVGPEGSSPLELTPQSVLDRLEGSRMAIADPDTVPAGRYGQSSLISLGLLQVVGDRLAPMENVRIALGAVARGDTLLGLVYATDARIEPNVSVVAELPKDSHPPISYPAALSSSASHPAAADYLAFLSGPKAQEILRSFGFVFDN
ncbi:molybdate ABC transporter substrate-binding protein [Roseibium denhamense]|uniref:Molybdate transport system substrate-binding protein n=1 Tax=Roseibium denhamense TaxID=76305 RepID=A0ABY1PCG9_9HYPH|nr:molybdate ABC transporter substrate-binding protein [Roseibium denhamense]MTI04582.1 molybdate ABC transporter substrate-binding protein [Roseibium denhamense]SMP31168.1 molybdate transport system substrate-binding protein [Roseibium denhamense]